MQEGMIYQHKHLPGLFVVKRIDNWGRVVATVASTGHTTYHFERDIKACAKLTSLLVRLWRDA